MSRNQLFFVVSSYFFLLPSVSVAQNALQAAMQKVSNEKSQKVFIEQFAQQAKAKDTASIMAEMDPSVVKAVGAVNMVHRLKTQIFPFFTPYLKLSNYDQMTNATMPDGRVGIWHYTYIATAQANRVPFRIAVIETVDGPKILDIVVNECVKGRHPVCQ